MGLVLRFFILFYYDDCFLNISLASWKGRLSPRGGGAPRSAFPAKPGAPPRFVFSVLGRSEGQESAAPSQTASQGRIHSYQEIQKPKRPPFRLNTNTHASIKWGMPQSFALQVLHSPKPRAEARNCPNNKRISSPRCLPL